MSGLEQNLAYEPKDFSCMNNPETIFFTASTAVFSQIASFLPRLIGATSLFVIGVILANWAKKITTKLVTAVNLHHLVKNTGIEKFLKQAELPHAAEEFIGQTVRWIIILIFFIATMNLLGLTAVSEVLTSILAYVPNVIGAILILALGILVAGFLESMVKGAMTELDGKIARLLGKITSYTIMVFSILAAVSQLKIAEQFIHILFTGVVAMLALGLGLAIGLCAKDTVSEI